MMISGGGTGAEFSDKDRMRAMQSMRDMFGPNAVDNAIRQALNICWMCLPAEKKNVEELSVQMRRILERALANAKEDEGTFRLGGPTDDSSTQG
jgi:hypothetical protein